MNKEETRNAQGQMLGVLADNERKMSMMYFPNFSSIHEAYAVIREEVEELDEELNSLRRNVEELWTACRYNEKDGFLRVNTMVYHNAKQAAMEALQVMAMAEKALMSLREDTKNDD